MRKGFFNLPANGPQARAGRLFQATGSCAYPASMMPRERKKSAEIEKVRIMFVTGVRESRGPLPRKGWFYASAMNPL